MLTILRRLFSSEKGQVGAFDDDVGTDDTQAPVEEQGNPEVDPFAVPERSEETEAVNPEGTQGQEQGEDTFLGGDKSNLDPRNLPPELQPIFKQMQGAYTRRMQEASQIREKAQVVDRFYADPQYAYQTLAQWANQNGYTLAPSNGQGRPTGSPQSDAPTYLVDALQQNLGPELQWLAEPLAKAQHAAMQGMLMPLVQQQQQARQVEIGRQWDTLASELSNMAPGWEEHEGTMGELFDYLSDRNQLNHPRYGSKLQMLYNLATGNAAAIKQATQRVQSASKNRVTSGRSNGSRGPSIESQVSKASAKDAWDLAVKHAMAQHPNAKP